MKNPVYLFSPLPDSRFAAELRQYGCDVRVVADRAVVPAGAFALIQDSSPPDWLLPKAEWKSERARRVFLLSCQRPPGMLRELEEYGVAGGVDHLRYASWESRPQADTGYGLFGLREIVDRMGATPGSATFSSENYCVFTARNSQSLTQSLASYLAAIDELE